MAATNRSTTMPPTGVTLRDPAPGDLGWIVHRHGALYASEHGYDVRFEGLVARVVADFAEGRHPLLERCWVAEHAGEVVGSVFVVRASEEDARLRLLYVEPAMRGSGLGAHLVDRCISFARDAGYTTLTLWTQQTLTSARRIYVAAGFELIRKEPHQMFGPSLLAEVWRLSLLPTSGR
jgi:GNAT superfamily N-acetyltransferase